MMSNAVIIFLRVPEKGRIKTRLSKYLPDTFVKQLYKGFVGDILDAVGTQGDKKLYFWPPEKRQVLEKWLGHLFLFFAQKGEDIGQRMANAFAETFESGYSRAVLIGTDIPEINQEIISHAFKVLQTSGAVIGPSTDGGYYLIGFQKTAFSKNIFNKIDWSTSRVLAQTCQGMDKNTIAYVLISPLDDIDTIEDLDALVARVKKGGKTGQRTHKVLRSYED